MLNFEKPIYKITDYIEGNNYGKFELEPLERGFGTTLGNALRRVMLSSMPGSAIVAFKAAGVMHEFTTIEGIVEDVTTIVLNLKSIVIKNHSEDYSYILKIHSENEGEILAKDIECDPDIEILNPDQLICTLAKGGKIDMEMTIGHGRGYNRAEENKAIYGEGSKEGTIFIDSLFSPIERINYEVENARVGQDNTYDKLILYVWTNGSITPEESIALASRILIEHFNILADLNEIADITGIMAEKEEDPKVKALETSIDDMEFSVRAYNCLKRSGINTMQDLVNRKESDMMKIRNLGKKSLKEVLDKVKAMGLSFKNDD